MDNLSELYERWVHPHYLRLLHGNFRGYLLAEELSEERQQMIVDLGRCLTDVSPSVVAALIHQPEWRARLVGGWYAGLRGWLDFRDELGALLVESQVCFACQGYCAALACFADKESANHLRRYLDIWLPQTDKFYDQHWALPALSWIDMRLGTRHAATYLTQDGLWDQWAATQQRVGPQFYQESQRKFDLALASALAVFRNDLAVDRSQKQ